MRLKQEVISLKTNSHELWQFATALFELELARKGDVDSRTGISKLAEVLLGFWRNGTGEECSRLHPALHNLWLSVTPMLMQFEARRFELALLACWQHRTVPAQLSRSIENLQPAGDPRAEFARCLYHLELARQGIESSRAEFARRAGLLAEAYQDPACAGELVGKDVGLTKLWGDVKPYLDEFFEHLEEKAAAKAHALTPEPAVRAIPSFDALVESGKPLEEAAAQPREAAPAEGWSSDIEIMEEEVKASAPRPPPLPNLTPPGPWTPPQMPEELEIVEAELDGPPPLPQLTPAHGLTVADDADVHVYVDSEHDPNFTFEPNQATLSFWEYTLGSLQTASIDGQKSRMLATESRADRKRLTSWLKGLGPHLPVPEARAFASLVRLLLASETKEKSLFGQPNPRRKESLKAAFSLLTADPEAAGRATVWFDLDGAETRAALSRGLDLMMHFITYCAQHSLDPLNPDTVAKYLEH